MADLLQCKRISCFGGFEHEIRAYTLIGFFKDDNDSCVTLIRGEEKDIPRLLKRYGWFTGDDIKQITSLNIKETYWADDYSFVIRIS